MVGRQGTSGGSTKWISHSASVIVALAKVGCEEIAATKSFLAIGRILTRFRGRSGRQLTLPLRATGNVIPIGTRTASLVPAVHRSVNSQPWFAVPEASARHRLVP